MPVIAGWWAVQLIMCALGMDSLACGTELDLFSNVLCSFYVKIE